MNPSNAAENGPDEEFQVLMEEYKRLNGEALARHAHRYHFHYIIIVIVVAAIAAYDRMPTSESKVTMLLLLPCMLLPIMVLMLKEHAYIDLRGSYIEHVLRPKIRQFLSDRSTHPKDYTHVLSWQSYEQEALRSSVQRFLMFGLFGLAAYAIPFLVSALSLLGAMVVNDTWETWEKTMFAIDGLLVFFGACMLVVARVWMPHVPNEYREHSSRRIAKSG